MIWKPIDANALSGKAVLLFSPYDEDINCHGGLIWVSGGWGRAAIDPHSFRGQTNKNKPTHYMLLPPSPVDGNVEQNAQIEHETLPDST
jgi:hypothetical protein